MIGASLHPMKLHGATRRNVGSDHLFVVQNHLWYVGTPLRPASELGSHPPRPLNPPKCKQTSAMHSITKSSDCHCPNSPCPANLVRSCIFLCKSERDREKERENLPRHYLRSHFHPAWAWPCPFPCCCCSFSGLGMGTSP